MEAKLQALKVVDLKKLLQDSNLPVSGAKADLVKRLLENPEATSTLGAEVEEDLLAEAIVEPTPTQAAAPAPASVAPSTSEPASVPAPPAPVSTSTNGKTETTASNAAPAKDDATLRAETIAELEKRKTRALRWGMPTEEIDAKLERVNKFGVESAESNVSLSVLDGELKVKGRKEVREERKAVNKEARQQQRQQQRKGDQAPLTEEEKATRAARNEADAEAKKLRAEKYGIDQKTKEANLAPALDPVEEEKKRKRLERFGAVASEPTEKKLKA